MMNEIDDIGCLGYTIATQSGLYFDYSRPLIGQIDIDDIARALGNTCRFGGHCSKFYSVAEHCFHCYNIAVTVMPEDVEFQLAVLMHDASEAYTGDMPKPLKNMMPDFRRMEHRVERAIEAKFLIGTGQHYLIKQIDWALLKAEKRVLFSKNLKNCAGLENIVDVSPTFGFYDPEEASAIFKQAFTETQNNRNL